MLTANDARKFTEQSEVLFNSNLKQVLDKIEEAAKHGKREINLSEAFRNVDKFQCNVPGKIFYFKPRLTEFQIKLKENLVSLGFEFSQKQVYIKAGGGLGLVQEDKIESETARCDIIVNW